MASLSKIYLDATIKRLLYYKKLGDQTFEQLNDVDFHYQPNDSCNSIAIIIQHLSGNMQSRWTNFLMEDGEKKWRNRDAEFENLQLTKNELILLWDKGWHCFLDAISPLTKKELKQTIYIRKEPIIVLDAINRQLAHYPYHVGQIIFIAKMIKGNNWKNLSIEKGASQMYNDSEGVKDPARKV